MSPKARATLLVGGVVATAVWLTATLIRDNAPPLVRTAAAISSSPGAAAVVIESPAETGFELEVPETLPWPADPFRLGESKVLPKNEENTPKHLPDSTTRQFVLKAILDGENPRAIVDGLVVAVGDRLPGGETVTGIDAQAVALIRADGRRVVLQLPE